MTRRCVRCTHTHTRTHTGAAAAHVRWLARCSSLRLLRVESKMSPPKNSLAVCVTLSCVQCACVCVCVSCMCEGVYGQRCLFLPYFGFVRDVNVTLNYSARIRRPQRTYYVNTTLVTRAAVLVCQLLLLLLLLPLTLLSTPFCCSFHVRCPAVQL